MSDAECSVVVRDQRALLGSVDEPVVPDAGVEGEQALSDPHEDAEVGAAAVLFEPELALEGGWWRRTRTSARSRSSES
jgi:hypothetical protein